MLTNVLIENFRGFERLELHGLGRVNLVVGKNNAGKTSLLEALVLLADPTRIDQLPGLFRANQGMVETRFYRWLARDGVRAAQLSLPSLGTSLLLTRGAEPQTPVSLALLYEKHGIRLYRVASTTQQVDLRTHAVSVQHRSPRSLVASFAEAVRSPADERQLESLLALVDDRIKTVRLDVVQLSATAEQPFIAVDVGLSERIPLEQAGQGIYRLTAIFSELLGGKPDVCLIDELENGIHHTALPTLWRGLAEAAERLGVQVFATTHSAECLRAAHEVFSTRPTYDLRVLQLYRLGGVVSGRVLDAEHVEAAIEAEIDVR